MATVMTALLAVLRKRLASHIPLKDLADRVDKYPTYIQKLENGSIGLPSADLLSKLLAQYGLAVEHPLRQLVYEIRQWTDDGLLTSTDPGLHRDPRLKVAIGNLPARFFCFDRLHPQYFERRRGQAFILSETALARAARAARSSDSQLSALHARLTSEPQEAFVVADGAWATVDGLEGLVTRDAYCVDTLLVVAPTFLGTTLSSNVDAVRTFEFYFRLLAGCAMSPSDASALLRSSTPPRPLTEPAPKVRRLRLKSEKRRRHGPDDEVGEG